MASGKRHHVIPSIIYVVLFSAFCMSGPEHESELKETIFGPAKVQLSSGKFSSAADKLTAKLRENDLDMLGHFSKLSYADFRGSSCYEAIAAWAQENPQVETVYSIPMPDGDTLDSDTARLDLTGYGHSDFDALAAALGHFDKVEYVQLGVVEKDGAAFNFSDLKAIRESLPDADIDFRLSLLDREISPETQELDLTALSHDEVDDAAALLSCMTNLKKLSFGTEGAEGCTLTLDEVLTLVEACPGADIEYSFKLYGKDVDFNVQELDYSHVEISDDGALISRLLPYMKNCRTLDMDSTGVSYESLEKLRRDNPEVNIIWRIWFGKNYSVRTDVERIFASKPTVGGMITNDTAWRLKYCTEVKYLDLGHNDELTDFSFAANMPKLEVAIIAMTGITDISPLENCTELNYLELNSTNVADISVLSSCTKLRDVNIACCPKLNDISALYDIPMDRLWIGRETPVPGEQVAELKARQPGCNVNTTTSDPHGECWRYYGYDPEEPKYYWVPRYELLRNQLGYNYQEYSFYWLDKKCELEAPPEHRGKYGKEVYGLD